MELKTSKFKNGILFEIDADIEWNGQEIEIHELNVFIEISDDKCIVTDLLDSIFIDELEEQVAEDAQRNRKENLWR